MILTDCLQEVFEYVSHEDTTLWHQEKDDIPKVRPNASYARLREVLELTDRQVEIFTVILEQAIAGKVDTIEVAKTLGITKIQFISLKPDLDVLASKRYILYNPVRIRFTFFIVPNIVIDAIIDNRKPSVEDLGGMSMPKFVKQLDSIYRSFYNDEIDFHTLAAELSILYTQNEDNELVVAYNSYNLDEALETYEKVLLNYIICRVVYHNENCFGWENYGKLFFESELSSHIKSTIDNGNLILQSKGILEFENSDGFEHREFIRMSNKALKEFLSQFELVGKNRRQVKNQVIRIISHEEVTHKQLFFNDSENKELDRLTNMLQKDHYNQIISRLEKKGMRKGVTCLFYGAPGTGKTASCYNLSAATGRDIFFIDMAQIKSKWVGESEENLSNLFRAYRKAVRESELAPIMVWNEADAIFGKRRNVTNAVDKMENAMQNIILQELEDLEGILIATTNFSIKDGFDPAMERRFLIKINFEKPQVEARTKIWQSMFTDISEADAHTLAAEFDFAGGLIENINRKATVDYILNGQQPSLDYLRELCVAERMGSGISTHIGF